MPAHSSVQHLLTKYPDKVPIILERHAGSGISEMANRKFLVPRDLTVAQFQYMIRKRISLPATDALYLFFNNELPSMSMTMGALYTQYHHPDDLLLHGVYASECTFG